MIEKGIKEAVMRYLTLKGFALGLLTAVASTLFPAPAMGVTSDPRFFGTYCGEYRETKTIEILRKERTYHADLAITARLSHAAGGVVTGAGKMRVKSHNIPERHTDLQVGQIFPFVVSGLVTAPGQVQGSGRTPGSEATESTATLHTNGDTLTLSVMDRDIELSKSGCGNTRPRVSIQPLDDDSIPWSSAEYLVGEYDDGEDENIPDERLVWTSTNLDGHLGNGSSILTYDLSPGRHTITFTATDSGGLRGSATTVINIENQAPSVRINRPWEGTTHYENVPVIFRGQAYDREDGVLTGSNLGWSASGLPLGTGTRFWKSLYAGTHTIRLYAYDNAMTSRQARRDAPYDEVTIEVIPCQTPEAGSQPAVSSAPSDTAAGGVLMAHSIVTTEREPRMRTYIGAAPPKQPAPPAKLRAYMGAAQPATPTIGETKAMATPHHPVRKGCPPAVMITAPDHLSQPVTGLPSESTAPAALTEHGLVTMERETGLSTELLTAQPTQPAPPPSAITMTEAVQQAQPAVRTRAVERTPRITPANPFCLTLAASAYDVEDGDLSGDDVEWTIRPCCGSYEPRILTGGNINACDFIADHGLHRHTITVKATDSDENTAIDSVDIIVIPAGADGVGLH